MKKPKDTGTIGFTPGTDIFGEESVLARIKELETQLKEAIEEHEETIARQAKQLEMARILYYAAIKLVDCYSKEKFPLNQTVTIEDVMRWYDKELEAIEQGEGT